MFVAIYTVQNLLAVHDCNFGPNLLGDLREVALEFLWTRRTPRDPVCRSVLRSFSRAHFAVVTRHACAPEFGFDAHCTAAFLASKLAEYDCELRRKTYCCGAGIGR
jgi:hypothetical protein